ncbi:MAG: helix-turn-helix domain-containing protein [Aerococcus sp.]|nr:helix-turn-helix domain-containing protein [Aerococcus sp.]
MSRTTWHDWTTSERLDLLRHWARTGYTDEEIAEKIGIKRPTIYAWKKKSSDITDALKKGKEIYDYEMEDALLQRGQGEWVEEEKSTQIINEDGSQKTIIEKKKRYIPPDTSAIIFWLKNRQPDRWRQLSPAYDKKTQAETEKLAAEAKKAQMEAALAEAELMPSDTEVDDGFMEALRAEGESVWND